MILFNADVGQSALFRIVNGRDAHLIQHHELIPGIPFPAT